MILIYGLIIFWVCVLFFDTILSSCFLPPYIRLKELGLSVKVLTIQVYTTRWNRCLQKWSCRKPRLQKLWFDIGVYVTFVLLPISIYLLLKSASQMLTLTYNKIWNKQSHIESNTLIMQPVLPGVNIPIEEFPYYFITLTLCSVIHELGHALAATREDVRVQGFGFFFTIIFPGAYVDLPDNQLTFLTPWQKLRIFTAGVWHNVALAAVAVALLFSTPYLCSPLFSKGSGLTVLYVLPSSGANGEAGLHTGDIITSIYGYPVHNHSSWFEHLKSISADPQRGFCVPSNSSWKQHNKVDCCTSNAQTHLCFQETNNKNFYCLQARSQLKLATKECIHATHCAEMENCIKPAFPDNITRLIVIKRRIGKDVLFVGPTRELFQAVSAVDYIPRYWISPRIIHMWETFLKYIMAFSGALAILNIIPCFYMDGMHIIKTIVDYFLAHVFTSAAIRNLISNFIICFGSCLLVAVVALGVLSFF